MPKPFGAIPMVIATMIVLDVMSNLVANVILASELEADLNLHPKTWKISSF